MNIKLILNLSCVYDRISIVTNAFLFPIPIGIRLLLPLRLPPCIQLSVFPFFPVLMLTFLAVSTAVSYGNVIDI